MYRPASLPLHGLIRQSMQLVGIVAIMMALLASVATSGAARDSSSEVYCETGSDGNSTCYETITVTAPESINSPPGPTGSTTSGGFEMTGGGFVMDTTFLSPMLQNFENNLLLLSKDQLIADWNAYMDKAAASVPGSAQYKNAWMRAQIISGELQARGC